MDRGPTEKTFFQDKTELSPIQFPRFWIPFSKARELFGDFETAPKGLVAGRARLFSKMTWEEVSGENIFALIPGADSKLQKELVMVEAFYDSTALIPGSSPGADEACSVATLLELARSLKQNPPARSVLLVATTGHAQALAGMRELIWSLRSKSIDLKRMSRRLEAIVKQDPKYHQGSGEGFTDRFRFGRNRGRGFGPPGGSGLDGSDQNRSGHHFPAAHPASHAAGHG